VNLDTSEMEARLENRIADRVVREVARLLNGKPTADRLIPLKEVATRVGRSKRTVNDMAKRGEFPRWAVVLKGSKMWSAEDVEGWVRELREEAGSV